MVVFLSVTFLPTTPNYHLHAYAHVYLNVKCVNVKKMEARAIGFAQVLLGLTFLFCSIYTCFRTAMLSALLPNTAGSVDKLLPTPAASLFWFYHRFPPARVGKKSLAVLHH